MSLFTAFGVTVFILGLVVDGSFVGIFGFLAVGVKVFFFDWVGDELSEGVAFLVVVEARFTFFAAGAETSLAVFSLAGCIGVDSFLAGVALIGVDVETFWAGASLFGDLTEAFAIDVDLP